MLVPADFATIYNVNPLWSAGIDGAGQSIAVLARSNIYLSDIDSFRRHFGLKANTPQIILTNSDPGIKPGDVIETTLDTEWAGAVAPGATIKVIVSSSSPGADGVDLSATYAVNKNVAPIITVSYAGCEASLGAARAAFYHSLWRQAAAQGQTVLVASGDWGAAGCDAGSTKGVATKGKAVNGLCSSPFATCVGGTQFVEGANPGQYWFPSAPDTATGTAMGYIPETAWNESASASASGPGSLAATGGGASTLYPKPAWQMGPGVPADGKRDVPDVSLTAAGHDGYTVVQGGMLGFIMSISGTSASTPSFAGIVALLNQKVKSPQGNINPSLYTLARTQAPVFHDITSGNNSVPGLTGFPATAGYDLATGLGSVDANLLVTLWNTAATNKPPLTVFAGTVTMNQGQTATANVTTLANGLNSAVTLAVGNLPTGITASFTNRIIAAPGAGTARLAVTAAPSVAPGIYDVTLTASAGTQTATSTFSVIVTAPTFTLSYPGGLYPMLTFGPNPPYSPATIPLQTFPANGFNSTITFAATGLPTGMTVNFQPATVTGTSVGRTAATVSVANTVKGGNYKITITASGGGVTRSVQYLVNVFVQPSCSLKPDQFAVAFKAGSSANFVLSCTGTPGGNTLNLSTTGAPGGLTATLSSPTVTAGNAVTLNLAAAASTNPGIYALTVTATETNGAIQQLQLFPAISAPRLRSPSPPAK